MLRVSSGILPFANSTFVRTEIQSSSIATALSALKEGKLVPRTFVDYEFVIVNSEKMIRRLFSKNFTVSLGPNGFYFFSPPGLIGGAPKVNQRTALKEMSDIVDLLKQALNGKNYDACYEHLLSLSTILFFSKPEGVDPIIIHFMSIVDHQHSAEFPIKLKCQILHFLKLLVLSNLSELGNQRVSQEVFDAIAHQTRLFREKSAFPESSKTRLYTIRAIYELETAKLFLERQFYPPGRPPLQKLTVTPPVVKALERNSSAMNDCLKTGLQDGIASWTAISESEAVKRLVAIELINHILLNQDALKHSEKLTNEKTDVLCKQLMNLFSSAARDLSREGTWLFLYACLDGLCALASLPDNKTISRKIVDFLVLNFSISSRHREARDRVEAKIFEVLWLLSCTGAISDECKTHLNAIIGKQPPEINWLVKNDFDDTLGKKKPFSDFIPIFVIDSAKWRNQIVPIYRKMLNDQSEFQRDALAISNVEKFVSSEEIKLLVGKELLGKPDDYLKNFSYYTSAITKGAIIAPLTDTIGDFDAVRPTQFKAHLVPPPPAPPRRDDPAEELDITPEDREPPAENNPFRLPALALNLLNGTITGLSVMQTIFCIDALMKVASPLKPDEKPNLVILFGQTGVGKSTTANLLSGFPLIRRENPNGDPLQLYDLRNPQEGSFPIGLQSRSLTFVPQLHRLESDLCLCDSPGTFDNRGFQVRIAEAVAMSTLINQAGTFRIFVILESCYLIAQKDDGDLDRNLKDLVDRLGGPRVFFSHLDALLFGITKFQLDHDARKTLAFAEGRLLAALYKLLPVEQRASFSIDHPAGSLINQIVYIDPDLPTCREDILAKLKLRTPIRSTPQLFRTVIGEVAELNLAKVTRALNQLIRSHFKNQRYQKVLQYLNQMTYLQHIENKQSENYYEEIKELIGEQIKDVIREIKELVPDRSPKRSLLRNKLVMLEQMLIFSAHITLDPPLTDIVAAIESEIRQKEEEFQRDRYQLAQSEYVYLRKQFQQEFQIQEEAHSFATYQEVTNSGLLGVTTRIEDLTGEIQTEENNRAAMYCNGNLVSLVPLLEEIENDLNLVVFEIYMRTQLAQIEAGFNFNLPAIKEQSEKIVNLYFKLFYDREYQINSYLEKLSSLHLPVLELSELVSLLESLEELRENRGRLSERTRDAFNDAHSHYHSLINRFFSDLKEKMCSRMVEHLQVEILRPLEHLDSAPPADWNANCEILTRLDKHAYAEVIRRLRADLIDDPKTTIDTELESPSQGHFQILQNQLARFALAGKLPSVFRKEGDETEACQKKRIIASFVQRLIADFETFVESNAEVLTLSDITWAGLAKAGFSTQKMTEFDQFSYDLTIKNAKKNEFLSAARAKTRNKIARAQYDLLQRACQADELGKMAAEGKVAPALKIIQDIDVPLYQKAVQYIRRDLERTYTVSRVNNALGVSAFAEAIHFVTIVRAIHNQVGEDINSVLDSLNNRIEEFKRQLIARATEELRAPLTLNEYLYLSVAKIQNLRELSLALEEQLLDPLKAEYITQLRQIAEQFRSSILQNEKYHDTIRGVAKQLVKNFMMAVSFDSIELFKKTVRSAIGKLDRNTKFYLVNSLAKLQESIPGLALDISGLTHNLPEFKDDKRVDRFPQTSFSQAVERLTVEPKEEVNSQKLNEIYERFNSVYTALLDEILQKTFKTAPCLENASKLAAKLDAKKLFRSPNEVGELLAYIFAHWTYTHTDENHDYTQTSDLLQPHPAQILAILRLIGADRSSPLQNHVDEILTGEGKSVCLGAAATIFALMGHDVSVMCYNPYLSDRDQKLFDKHFKLFNISNKSWSSGGRSGKVTYGNIDSIVSNSVESHCLPNRSNHIRSLIMGTTPGKFEKKDASKQVLLIDEIDVFFGPDFYSKLSGMIHILKTEESIALIKWIWNNRDKIFAGTYTFDTIMLDPVVQYLLKAHPKLTGIVQQEVRKMLRGILQFPVDGTTTHRCEIRGNTIGYSNPATCTVNWGSYVSDYSTQFAYIYYKEKGEISSIETDLGLSIDCGSYANSKIPEFFPICLGVTGTVKDLSLKQKEILKQYGISQFSYIPSIYVDKQKVRVGKTQVKKELSDYYIAIKESLSKCVEDHRAALVVFDTIEKLKKFQEWLKDNPAGVPTPGVLTELLESEKRQTVIYESTTSKKVTLMTRQYGRGTDFVCYDKRVIDKGGVHVIAAFLPESAVEETQIRGRTGRLDNPGSFEKILWAQDLLSKNLITKEQLNALASVPDSVTNDPLNMLHDILLANSITDDTLNVQRDILLAKQFETIQTELKSAHATHEKTCQLMEAIKNGEKQKAFDMLTGVDLSVDEDDN